MTTPQSIKEVLEKSVLNLINGVTATSGGKGIIHATKMKCKTCQKLKTELSNLKKSIKEDQENLMSLQKESKANMKILEENNNKLLKMTKRHIEMTGGMR